MKTWGPWEHPQTLIPRLVREEIGEFESLLDVGGGGGTVGHGYWPSAVVVGVLDIFPPRVTPPRFTLGSALDVVKIYGPKSFDVVMACEVLEHVPFGDGQHLLALLKQVARKMVILTTPHGFAEQDPEKSPDEPWANNPHQKHLCGWCHTNLQESGYNHYFNGNEDGIAAQLVGWWTPT